MNVDRYDRAVLQHLSKADEPLRTRHLNQLYRSAGVRDKWKIRNRIKHLSDEGLIEKAGDWLWEYNGPKQEAVA